MRKYSLDPRFITAKFNSNCSKCKTAIKAGEQILHSPADAKIYCNSCGTPIYQDFLSNAMDEEVYYGTGNPY